MKEDVFYDNIDRQSICGGRFIKVLEEEERFKVRIEIRRAEKNGRTWVTIFFDVTF
jgi:hypothetical protein